MLQQASKLLFTRVGLQHAAAASCTCLQQQMQGLAQQQSHFSQQQSHFLQQARSKSSCAGPVDAAAGTQQPNSGWSWFGGSSQSAAAEDVTPSEPAAAAAAPGDLAPPAAAPVPDLYAADLISHADALVDVSSVAAAATVAAAKASCWWGTKAFMSLMLYAHDSWHFPWFEAICASNVLVRILSFCVAVFQQRVAPSMANMRADTQQLQALGSQLSKAATAAEYAQHTENFQKASAEFNLKYKGKKKYVVIGPALAIVQGALFISQFSAISTLASAKLPSMTYEGAAWFTDLTAADPIMLLPVACAALTLVQVNTKRFQDVMMQQPGGAGAAMKPIMNAMAGVILIVGWFQPSAVALLWASNTVIAIGQNAVLTHPGFRKAMGLQPMPEAKPAAPGSKPAQSLWQQLKDPQAALDALRGKDSSSSSSSSKAVPAAPVPPPPGTPVAVNYVSTRPSRRRGRV